MAVREFPRVPVIVTPVLAVTGRVVTEKLAVVAFAATVTLAGTVAAAVLLLDRVTVIPAAGAGPVKVTVPVEDVPPVTVAGLTLTEVSEAAVTVRDAVLVTP